MVTSTNNNRCDIIVISVKISTLYLNGFSTSYKNIQRQMPLYVLGNIETECHTCKRFVAVKSL